ncbi:MAG: transglutaminaseTgpA domain-containing protein [Chloroflexota bacterium]
MSRFIRLQEGWLTVGLLAMLLFSVTLSIQQAQWSDGLSILTPITLIGLATGIILAKVRGVPRFLLDLVGLLIGINTILIMVSTVMRDARLVTVQDRVQDLLARSAGWINVAIRQDMSDDLVVFILSLAIVAWVLAYSSAYFVFRSRQLWWALVPNGVALLINLSYSPVNLNGYIVVFMFSALLLMIRFNLLMKEERWQRERVNYSPGLTWAFLWAGSAVSIAVALAMWYVPASAVNGTLSSVWEKVNQPWHDFENRMAEAWGSVNGNKSLGGYSSFNKSFTMGGSLNLSDDVALIVTSQDRHYWRATTWDEYTGMGWRNTSESTFHIKEISPRLALDANQQLISQDDLRTAVTYTVQVVNPKADVIFASLRPIQLSIPTRLEVSWRPLNDKYDIDSSSGPNLNNVPLELRNFVGLLHQAQRDLRNGLNPCTKSSGVDCLYSTVYGPQIAQQIEQLKNERGINTVLEVGASPNFSITLSATGEVPVYDDLSGIHAVNPLNRNDRYDVVSLVSEATDTQLREVDNQLPYPDWVVSRYTLVPATVPASVGELADAIVRDAGAVTAYDKAKAIEQYLRNNYEYTTTITAPPAGVDRVEWFLFQSKKGYCEYYASSMVIMLRHLGIPARLAGGYAPGNIDPKSRAYIIKESSAHAWPEVYFPKYGWIEFEPTPSQAVITHEENSGPSAETPSPEPTADAALSPTPTEAPDRNPKPPLTTDTTSGGSGISFGPVGGGLLLAGVVAAVVALLFFLPFSPFRRKRLPGSARFYYQRMLFWSKLLRAGPASHQTPYEFGESLAREVPGTGLFTRSIARAYVRERFGRESLDTNERRTLSEAYTTLRSRLWRSLPARRIRRMLSRKP